MDPNERNAGEHPLLRKLDPNDPTEVFYGYHVTRTMTEPPPIPSHPGPDSNGKAPARRQEIEEVLFSVHPSPTTAARFRGGVFLVTDHGVFEEGARDGQRPRRTNKGDTRKRGR